MRLAGFFLLAVGGLCILAGIALNHCQPLICPGVASALLGLAVVLLTNRLRATPTRPANERVETLFDVVAEDEDFVLIAQLNDSEVALLRQDLASASYRLSSVVQGGFAGRNREQLILALSPWHLRPAAAAHELFHLARDVLYRRRGGKAGQPLDDPESSSHVEGGFWLRLVRSTCHRCWESARGLKEERMVWYQTLTYRPLGGSAELAVPLCVVFLAFVGAYLFAWHVC